MLFILLGRVFPPFFKGIIISALVTKREKYSSANNIYKSKYNTDDDNDKEEDDNHIFYEMENKYLIEKNSPTFMPLSIKDTLCVCLQKCISSTVS